MANQSEKNLYVKIDTGFHEATEAEIISAYSRLTNARRGKTNKGGRPPALDARKRVRALSMLAQGAPQTAIAKRLGVSQATISKLANE